MRMRMLLALCAALALTVGVGTATAGGGNSANTEKCQKGGWQHLYRSDGSSFANQGECVAYGAQSGTPSATADISVSGALIDEFGTYRITVANAGPGTATVTMQGYCDSAPISAGDNDPWIITRLDEQTIQWTASIASGESKQFVVQCQNFSAGHVEVFASSLLDPDSTPNNANTAEDDYSAIPHS